MVKRTIRFVQEESFGANEKYVTKATVRVAR